MHIFVIKIIFTWIIEKCQFHYMKIGIQYLLITLVKNINSWVPSLQAVHKGGLPLGEMTGGFAAKYMSMRINICL